MESENYIRIYRLANAEGRGPYSTNLRGRDGIALRHFTYERQPEPMYDFWSRTNTMRHNSCDQGLYWLFGFHTLKRLYEWFGDDVVGDLDRPMKRNKLKRD